MRKILATLAIVALAGTTAHAQISYHGGTYSEDFDSMGSTGTSTPTGWFVGTGTGAANTGTTVAATNGSNTAANNYNFGGAGTHSVNDRALGSLASSTGGQRDTEVDITNNSGSVINSFTIEYDGEQWRTGGSSQGPNTLTLQMSTDGTTWTALGSSFNFTSPINNSASGTALDGNAAANSVANIGGNFILGTPIPIGATFYFRWADPDDAGTDAGLAIDNFYFRADPIPEPAALMMFVLGGGLLAAVQRIRSKRG